MAEGKSARIRALNAEMHECARRHDFGRVMSLLEGGEAAKTVDGRSFAIAISACADAGDGSRAVELLGKAIGRGGKAAPGVEACTAAVKALCGSDLGRARALLRAMGAAPGPARVCGGALGEAARPNVRSANTFLRGCLRHGDVAGLSWCLGAMAKDWALAADATGRAGEGRDVGQLQTAPLSVAFHSFRLLFGRAILSRSGLEA